jgi:hypothetical protein
MQPISSVETPTNVKLAAPNALSVRVGPPPKPADLGRPARKSGSPKSRRVVGSRAETLLKLPPSSSPVAPPWSAKRDNLPPTYESGGLPTASHDRAKSVGSAKLRSVLLTRCAQITSSGPGRSRTHRLRPTGRQRLCYMLDANVDHASVTVSSPAMPAAPMDTLRNACMRTSRMRTPGRSVRRRRYGTCGRKSGS